MVFLTYADFTFCSAKNAKTEAEIEALYAKAVAWVEVCTSWRVVMLELVCAAELHKGQSRA